MPKSTERPQPAPAARGAAFAVAGGPVVRAGQVQPISQATVAHGLVFVAGQVPMRAGQLAAPDIAGQTRYTMDAIAAILAQAGARWQDVLKVTVWLTQASDYADFHAAYGDYLGPEGPHPARSTVISGLLAPVKIEMEVVAALPHATP